MSVQKKTHGASKSSAMKRQLLVAVRKCVKYRSQRSPQKPTGAVINDRGFIFI